MALIVLLYILLVGLPDGMVMVLCNPIWIGLAIVLQSREEKTGRTKHHALYVYQELNDISATKRRQGAPAAMSVHRAIHNTSGTHLLPGLPRL